MCSMGLPYFCGVSWSPLLLLSLWQCSSWNMWVFGRDHRWYQNCFLGFIKTKQKSKQKKAFLFPFRKQQNHKIHLGPAGWVWSLPRSVNKPSKPHFTQSSGVWWVAPSSKYWQISQELETVRVLLIAKLFQPAQLNVVLIHWLGCCVCCQYSQLALTETKFLDWNQVSIF